MSKRLRRKRLTARQRARAYELLEQLFEREHGGCDDTTCSMSVAFAYGYRLHALSVWGSTSAASWRFGLLLNYVRGSAFDKAERREVKAFLSEVSHAECECGSYVYVYELECNDGYCSNCGGNASKNTRTRLGELVFRTIPTKLNEVNK
jgi:hypothetical protein